MKTEGRRQSKNVSKDTPKTRGQLMLQKQEQNRALDRFYEAERAVPKKVSEDMDRAHMNDVIKRINQPRPKKQDRLPRNSR